ncbi:hypothetical protein CL689_06110 [Candidatus Saccharibacteria bacterium]|nr:hypothetical protein [Candidatus Saccharibacteria bacterium]
MQFTMKNLAWILLGALCQLGLGGCSSALSEAHAQEIASWVMEKKLTDRAEIIPVTPIVKKEYIRYARMSAKSLRTIECNYISKRESECRFMGRMYDLQGNFKPIKETLYFRLTNSGWEIQERRPK